MTNLWSVFNHDFSLFFTCERIIYLCFSLCQALEIQNLYKISLETHVQCLECSSVQTKSTYLLNLPLHVQEDDNSLVRYPFCLDLDIDIIIVPLSEVVLTSIPNANLFRKAACPPSSSIRSCGA